MTPRDELAIEQAEDARDHGGDNDRAEHRHERMIWGEGL